MPPPSASLAALAATRSRIFGTTHNPTHARTGARILRQRLVGPSMTQYYPAQVSFRELRRVVPELGLLVDPRETQRLKDVERKKMLGKGPPKKGEGRRATMKSKGKK